MPASCPSLIPTVPDLPEARTFLKRNVYLIMFRWHGWPPHFDARKSRRWKQEQQGEFSPLARTPTSWKRKTNRIECFDWWDTVRGATRTLPPSGRSALDYHPTIHYSDYKTVRFRLCLTVICNVLGFKAHWNCRFIIRNVEKQLG